MRPALEPVAKRPIALVAAVAALVLTGLSGRYGFHRDELYFLAAAERPALGYVDQPPLTPMLAKLSVTLFGDTPAGLRVVATLAFVCAIVLVGLIARELGAGRVGQVLAVVGAGIGGFGLGVGHMVSTAGFDMVAWLALSAIVIRLMRGGDPRWWVVAGVTAGAAVWNKYLVLLLIAALSTTWLAVGPRDRLRTRWLPVGIAVGAAITAPTLWWQAVNGWPQLTVAAGIGADDGLLNRAMLVPEQLVYLSPVLVPVWMVGWRRLWRITEVRAFAVAYPLVCLVVFVAGGKGYYTLPLLLVLLAAGAEPTAAWLTRAWRGRLPVVVVTLCLGFAGSAVVSLPVLPASALTLSNAVNAEQGEQVGWPELVDSVAIAWGRLDIDDRDEAVVFTENYGQAGAVERFGPDRSVPAPYSGHMSYADWGPPPDTHRGPVIVVHDDDTVLTSHFLGCEPVAVVDNGHGVDNEEQGTVVSLCRGTAAPWSVLWRDLRHYY